MDGCSCCKYRSQCDDDDDSERGGGHDILKIKYFLIEPVFTANISIYIVCNV